MHAKLRLLQEINYPDRPDVRSALHVSPLVTRSYFAVDNQTYYSPGFEGSAWVYDVLRDNGYEMLHIMGTSDGMFSMKGLWNWIKTQKWPVTKKWAPVTTELG